MSSGQIAFYATVATAIPVVLVIYIVGAGELARRRIEHIVDLLAEKSRPRLWTRKQARARRRASTNRFVRTSATSVPNELLEYGRMLAVNVIGPVTLLALTGMLGFLVLSPVVGEYFALHALASDRATADATTWAAIGLATTGAYLLAPFLWRLAPGLWVGVVMSIVGIGIMAVYTIALLLQATWKLVQLAGRPLGRNCRPSHQSDPEPPCDEHKV